MYTFEFQDDKSIFSVIAQTVPVYMYLVYVILFFLDNYRSHTLDWNQERATQKTQVPRRSQTNH